MITVKRSDFKMEKVSDDTADTSQLGKYVNTYEEGAIDRKERGDMQNGQKQYFVPANPEGRYAEENYKRLEALNNGEWSFIVIKASITFRIPQGKGSISQTITSPGLNGIEDDSGEDCFKEIFLEESDILESMLVEMGIKVDV